MLNGATLSTAIESALSGFTGPQKTLFCLAIGSGIVTAVSGILTFTTTENGSAGAGTGTGTGVMGMSGATIASLIQSTGNGFWGSLQRDGPGIQWPTFCSAVGSSVVTHFALAHLASTNPTVCSGTGTVQAYSGVTMNAMKSAIVSAAPMSWSSHRFSELAEAVATGVVTHLLGHTSSSTVTITPNIGVTPGGPLPGTGSGIVT